MYIIESALIITINLRYKDVPFKVGLIDRKQSATSIIICSILESIGALFRCSSSEGVWELRMIFLIGIYLGVIACEGLFVLWASERVTELLLMFLEVLFILRIHPKAEISLDLLLGVVARTCLIALLQTDPFIVLLFDLVDFVGLGRFFIILLWRGCLLQLACVFDCLLRILLEGRAKSLQI